MELPSTSSVILGIESSCDETAAAVVVDGKEILSSVVASQVKTHAPYGGVVPELASRKHIENIVPVTRQALLQAGVSEKRLNAVAATRGPGLVGALLVGFSFAKAFSWALGIPLIGVNHLDGHLASAFFSSPAPEFPFVALLASGGHTAVYHVVSHTRAELMGQTRDDAAGEAYDKVAKMMGLGYPGGSAIEKLAAKGDPQKIHFTRPFVDKSSFDFSFSGIKTAAGRVIREAGERLDEEMPHIAAGFQQAVADVLCHKLIHAAKTRECRHIAMVGGVAANRTITGMLRRKAENEGLVLHVPPLDLCGDNAAMIAAAGFFMLREGKTAGLESDVYARVPAPVSKTG